MLQLARRNIGLHPPWHRSVTGVSMNIHLNGNMNVWCWYEDRIRFCLNKALDLIDWKKVSDDLWQHLSIGETLRCPRHYEDLDWLRELWNDQDMNDSLVVAILNLRSWSFNDSWRTDRHLQTHPYQGHLICPWYTSACCQTNEITHKNYIESSFYVVLHVF